MVISLLSPEPHLIAELCAAVGMPIQKGTLRQVELLFRNDPKITSRMVRQGNRKLEHIQRFRGLNMNRRDTVGDHIARLSTMLHAGQHWLQKGLSGFAFDEARHAIFRHDLPEGLNPFGDIPTPTKRHLPEHLKRVLDEVELACFRLIAHVPDGSTMLLEVPIFGFENHAHHLNIIMRYLKRDEPWTQVVKYFDMLDAFMEALYECVFHGSHEFETIAQRYLTEFASIASGEYLPVIRNIHDKRHAIMNWLTETFGDDYPQEMDMYSRAGSLFDIQSMTIGKCDAFRFWVEHILPSKRAII